ncbi:zinc-dependent alcohol dehydrogenase family protein [Sphingomonas colocasiae]|uniref:Zinc-dependent alcohol dehydrogenase family protein n=1 Tax=Sphingomonas colocasiae TaxID=1848973 RepID=A0ABS7PLD0_9SPHN|nr:zinc-dependent alcohol dehydrogenase family protein [Sphingomonas colocasiae]MBY8821779.1 zinc-dependent alcohol dehydrogenase family protein [Sphingomonas colocasiae]
MGDFRALRFHALGDPVEVLAIDRIGHAPLGTGEVRIQVAAFALNRADWLFTRGEHYSLPRLPSRIGSECAGTVVAVGTDVDPALVGRRVCTVPFHNADYGVQGEFATVPQAYLAPWPEDLTAEQAAAAWMQYLTAWFALIGVADIGPGDHVLIPAASSSAGLAAIQLARRRGAGVIATTRSPDKVEMIRAVGADVVLVVGDGDDLAARILTETGGKGVRVVFDPVGGPFVAAYLDALADDARIFIYGVLSGGATELDIVRLVRHAAVVHPYSMFNHVRHPEQLARAIAWIEAEIAAGLRPVIDTVVPFDDAIQAYRRLDSQEQIGKILVGIA